LTRWCALGAGERSLGSPQKGASILHVALALFNASAAALATIRQRIALESATPVAARQAVH